ncbi:MAG: hypothetical protein ACOC4G_10780 [Bacillota bacterium]
MAVGVFFGIYPAFKASKRGLAIVKKIFDLHEGKVKAVNEDGGVAFYLMFPLELN